MLSPRMAYVLLWFPLSSETFVFREIQQLVQRGMDIRVYTMYGEKLRGCSDEMRNYAGPIKRFGSVATLRLLKAFWRAWKRDRETVKTLMRRGLFRKMRNLEAYAENRRVLTEGLSALGYEFIEPQGAFYLWVKALEPDANAFFERAKALELLPVPSDSFGCPGWVRVGYCVSKETIVNSMPAWKKLAESYE